MTAAIDCHYQSPLQGSKSNFFGTNNKFLCQFSRVPAVFIDGRPAAIHGFPCARVYILVVSIPGIKHALRAARHDSSKTCASPAMPVPVRATPVAAPPGAIRPELWPGLSLLLMCPDMSGHGCCESCRGWAEEIRWWPNAPELPPPHHRRNRRPHSP